MNLRPTTSKVIVIGSLIGGLLVPAFAQQEPVYDTNTELLPTVDVQSGRLASPEEITQVQGTPVTTGVPGQFEDPNALEQATSNIKANMNSVASAYDQQFQVQPQETERQKFAKKIAQTWKPTQRFDLLPSENIVIPVAKGLMNSIGTNFQMLAARTSDEASILEIEKGYLYVTINSDQPVGVILYEDGVLESQVSVTLWPIDVPASIVKLDVSLSPEMQTQAAEYRKQIELDEKIEKANEEGTGANANSELSNHVISLLTPVAQGSLPRGFSMTNDIPSHLQQPCNVTISQMAGQRLTGGKEVIDVVLITNDTPLTYHVREEMCLAQGVKAVSVYEKAYLQPGEQTEVYILRDKTFESEAARKKNRPRLTDMQGGAE